jgi:tRNA nucleotidyltransferase (CCA-adding enzyme)
MPDLQAVTEKVLRKILPSEAEKARMLALAADLERKTEAALAECGVSGVVRVEGSVAKDTWLVEEPDVDVFMRLPTSISRKDLGEVALKIARKATEGSRQVERFAEHPYLEAFVEGTRVNIVPCYESKPGEWLSATDRTPYHTDYINKHLSKAQRNEVRLLKKFMKGIGVYGAEIKIGGFSGYLCELLVLYCGGFEKTLQTFANHVPRRVVDIEGYYANRQRELELLFPEALVIIDPVDKARNVASAVQHQKLDLFVAASRAFLKAPSEEYFYPPKTVPLTAEELNRKLESRGSALVFIVFKKVDAIPDVLWGQLHRTRRSLSKQLELGDFRVLRDAAWSGDTADFAVFVFELEQRYLSLARRHFGPPLEREKECESFLAKYTCNADVLAGPYVEEGRWVVQLKRKYPDAAALLREKICKGGKNIGVAELISQAFLEDFHIAVDCEVAENYQNNAEFAQFLTAFLDGKPLWLKC